MKVAIVGSRDFDFHSDKPMNKSSAHTIGMKTMIYDLVKIMDNEDYVVSGGANGADTHAEEAAHDWNVGRIVHTAHWDKHGKAAGHIRNKLIVRDSDVLFAFYTDIQTSRGTLNCVLQAQNKGIVYCEFDAKTDTWYYRGDHLGGAIMYNVVLGAIRNQVNQSTARKDEGAPFIHSYDMYGHQPGCPCWNGILGGGLGAP